MKNNLLKSIITAGMFIVFSGISQLLTAQATGPVKLSYNYPSDKAVRYITTSTIAQIMDMQGQTMQTDVNSSFGCQVMKTGNQDANLKLQIQIDTLGQSTNSPMGSAGGPILEVKGKTINVVVTPEGRPADMTEATNLIYNVEGSGESNMSQAISEFFPLLPSKPVSVGDSWNSIDSVSTKSSTTAAKTIDSTLNKLVAIETIDGMECAKISVEHTGKMTMTIQAQGMDIFLTGPFKGTSECLFAIKEGYFIKQTSETKVNGTLEISSMGMTMPIVIDTKSVSEVKK